MVQKNIAGNNFVWELARRKSPLYADLKSLEEDMRSTRENDFRQYFNSRGSQMPSIKTKYSMGTPMDKSPIFQL